MSFPQVVAHRGNKSVAPENTLPAFAAAIAVGADWIEMDIVLSKDGVAMVIHDETLEGTTSGLGKIFDFMAEQIQLLDAGSYFSTAYASTPVPTFTQFAALLAQSTDIKLLLEFKGEWSPQQTKDVIDIAASHGLADRTVLQSFNPVTVRSHFEVAPTWRRGVLTYGDYEGLFELCREVGSIMLNPDIVEVAKDPDIINRIQRAGMQAMVWTANDLEHWQLLIDLKADGFITDRPDFLAGWLTAKNLR